MASPFSPNLQNHSRASYEVSQRGMSRNVNVAEPVPMTVGEKISMHMDEFKDMLASGCCSCVKKLPSAAVVAMAAFVLVLLLAGIPAVFLLTDLASRTDRLSAGNTNLPRVIRPAKSWPEVDKVKFDVDGDGEDEIGGISLAALFPVNVSTCGGFGFSCSNAVHRVISTAQRCDGFADCDDRSDEEGCQTCQTTLSCAARLTTSPEKKSKKNKNDEPLHNLICLRPEQICDGVQHCPDGSDETTYCKATCGKDEIMCKGQNICLPKAAQCNGIRDCADGSDEAHCKDCVAPSKKCGKTCLKPSDVCNGVRDCEDGSDEKNCDCKTCSGSDKALCDDGTCISRSAICDGKMDCMDGMDERDCPGTCALKPKSAVKRITCSNGRQYPEDEACSGELVECEKSCKKCSAKAFFCSNPLEKKCIPRRMVCDGTPDCFDGEDEKNCECNEEAGDFKCLTERKCIDKSKRCDGVQDCYDWSDEKQCPTCPSTAWRCKSDNWCLPSSARCDGVTDCVDGSDESGCSCEECTRHSSTYMCDGSQRCLRREDVCRPYSTCPNATHVDKAYCAALSLKTHNTFPW